MFKVYYILVCPLTLMCLGLIGLYRLVFCKMLPKSCHFAPTCSKYAWDSIVEFGAIIGVYYAMMRILRCRTDVPGGYDYPKLNLLGNYKWKC